VYSEGSVPDAGRVGVAIQVRRKEGGKERASERATEIVVEFFFFNKNFWSTEPTTIGRYPPELRIDFDRRVVPLLFLFCVALGGLLDGKEASGRARGRVVGVGACAGSTYAGLRRPGSIGSFLSRKLAKERDWDYFCGVF
jgi:hypothetical protein